MKTPVVLSPKAEQELKEIATWWSKNRSPEQAERWYAGFVSSIKSLSFSHGRCSLAAENAEFPFEVLELHYGLEKKTSHRALFTIRQDMVYVFLIRHVAQGAVSLDDL